MTLCRSWICIVARLVGKYIYVYALLIVLGAIWRYKASFTSHELNWIQMAQVDPVKPSLNWLCGTCKSNTPQVVHISVTILVTFGVLSQSVNLLNITSDRPKAYFVLIGCRHSEVHVGRIVGWRRGVVVSGVRQWTKLTHVGPGYNWDGWPSSGEYTISGSN